MKLRQVRDLSQGHTVSRYTENRFLLSRLHFSALSCVVLIQSLYLQKDHRRYKPDPGWHLVQSPLI